MIIIPLQNEFGIRDQPLLGEFSLTQISHREYKKTMTYMYMLQMAIADFLFLLVLPLTAHSMLVGEWRFGEALCKICQCIR